MSNIVEINEEINTLKSVDKDSIPTCEILGVKIAAINMEWLVEFTQKNLESLSGEYICVSNVHTTVMSYEDEEYRNIQNGGIMAIPDGGPLSTLGRKRGFKNMERTTGPDYMENIFQISEEMGYKHYFYGSTDETLLNLKKKLLEKYPEIKIVGMYSPPFRELTNEENDEIVQNINLSSPDFLWVGLGAPKQEKWMASQKGKIKGLMVGVGAGFDYFAENITRAPKWMQQNNLEWLYRLKQNPKRLFLRYLTTNYKFIINALILNK